MKGSLLFSRDNGFPVILRLPHSHQWAPDLLAQSAKRRPTFLFCGSIPRAIEVKESSARAGPGRSNPTGEVLAGM